MKRFWLPLLTFIFSSHALATPPVIWGPYGKSIFLQSGYAFGTTVNATSVIAGSLDPSVTAVDSGIGSLYISTNGRTYQKQDNGLTTNWLIFSSGGGGGTVTSVAMTVPSEFSVAGSPVTTAGTLAVTSNNQVANSVWAGPASGPNAPPTFRSLVFADIPATPANTPDTVVSRDGSGSITVEDLTADGNISAANFSGSSSGTNTGDVSLGTFGSSPNSSGASLSGQVLTLQPANGSQPGGVSTTTQTFAGNKTFSGTIAASNFSGSSSGTNTGDVTLGTANGLSLVGQALSLGLSSASTTGALSSTDWSTFNSKQPAGSYITALTGDVTASGPGSAAATIANNVVSNAKLAQMPANTIKGNNTGSTANALDLTKAQVQTFLDISGVNTGDVTLATFGSTPNSSAASLSGQVLTLQPASGSQPGGVSTTTQTLAGNKTFSGSIAASNLSGTNTGDVTIGTANGLSLVGQALSLGLSSASTTGALSSTDWSTFNSKLTGTLTSAHIFVGNVSNVATDVAASGDLSLANTGAFTIGTNVVTNAKLAQMPTLTIKGNNTGGTANALDLTVAQTNTLLGTVVGPASATDTAVALYDTTTGKLIKNSVVTVGATGNTTGIATLNASGAVTFGNYVASRIPFTGTSGLITVDNSLVWDNTAKQMQISDLWLSSDTVSGRANDLTINTQTSGKNILLSPAGTGTTNASTDVILLNQKSLKLREGTGGGTNFAAFQAPATLAGDYTLTMPTALPGSTQALFSSSGGALSFAAVPTASGAFTDNHLLRADGTTGIQDSLGVLSDAGVLTGLTSAILGDITWSNADFFSSTSTMDFTSSGTMTMNSGTGDFNMIAFIGKINAAAKGQVQFASTSSSVDLSAASTGSFTADGGDLTLSSNNANVNVDAPTGSIMLNNDAIFGGAAAHQSNSSLYGSSNESSIKYDGTNLVINPANSGSGYVFIGDGATPLDLQARHMSMGDAVPSGVRMMNANETSATTSNGIFMTLTHTGATAAMRSMNFTATHSGSNTSPSAAALFTSTHTVDPSGTVTMIGVLGQANSGIASTQGTKVYDGIRGSVGAGSGNNGGTLRAASIHGLAPSITGSASITKWAGLFDDDVQIASDSKLLLEGSSTTKGDSYLSFISASNRIDQYVNNTNVTQQTATSLGTVAGTSTTFAKVGGTLTTNTTSTGNILTGVDDLQTYSVPANTLATNGDRIKFRAGGTFASNANSKQLRVVYGATQLITTGALLLNNGKWGVDCMIIRTGAATQKATCTLNTSLALLTTTTDYQTPAETLSGAVTLKMTGEAVLTNDIVEELSSVEYMPAQ